MVVPAQKIERHALVIGGGMAGMLAARILSDRFTRVSLLERDIYPTEPDIRPGVPQGRQVHILLVKGQQILAELFPGLFQRLVERGAIQGDIFETYRTCYASGWGPQGKSGLTIYSCTRTLLEWQVRQDLLRTTDVQVLAGHEVTGLHMKNGVVVGVKIRLRKNATLSSADLDTEDQLSAEEGSDIAADLVIDTSGRDSRIMRWLEEQGYPQPRETILNPYLGYASRFYKTIDTSAIARDGILMAADAPRILRAGIIMRVEGDRSMVVLAGMGKDYPPTDPEEFLEFARGLSDPSIYEMLKDAEPISPIYGYRKAENRWRHFEHLKTRPEGLLVMGDAACTFDPIYGQGMTVAALGAQALGRCIDRHGDKTIVGLAQRFQRELARVNRPAWQLSIGADFSILPPEEQKRSWLEKLIAAYTDHLILLLPQSFFLATSFNRVTNLVNSPASLFRPRIFWKVLTTRKPVKA